MKMRRWITRFVVAGTALGAAAGPAFGERGSDGDLKILYWQAVSIMNPYLSSGTKDMHAASMVIEPLARFDETGNIVPTLVSEIPSLENGGISEDLTTITWRILPDLRWSDGTDFTAEDVVFTWQYCTAPDGGCAQRSQFTDVAAVEAVDPLTVRVTFSVPKPYPFGPFVGMSSPIIQKAQFESCVGARAPECTEANFGPHGTGPFKVRELRANDVVLFDANQYYRDPAKPAFATATLKGGGDATSAARAVLESGEFDYGWNLMIEPEVLATMEQAGRGTLVSSFGSLVERIVINWTNPDPALGSLRSTREGGEHPFLSDPAVRRALSMAIDRDLLVDIGFGEAGQATCNIVPAPEINRSTGNDDWCLTADIEGANALLDEAGWVPGPDGIRAKDGVRLSMLYQTSTNSVRQSMQAIIKDMWSAIGVDAELRDVSSSVFFGGDPGSPDTFQKFFADVEMYANNFDGTDAESYLAEWTCALIPSPETGWRGQNIPRYCNPEYDALVAKLGETAEEQPRAEIVKQLNDMLTADGAHIPLVHRGDLSGHVNTLAGVRMNSWDSQLWNVADWYRTE
ncbi:peptide ABC transporter substrate-binding protein [Halotalea alkalilenta]|uniref:peptide ABC transporter substrate-binding protein n=1 Tax=Halotalea alkalilenta TaxID=376489 RepID=UPI000483EFDB|nr:peptide ABC transporter substrate-binding protein [Halotalea alkalilenta]